MKHKTAFTKNQLLSIWLKKGREVPEINNCYDPFFDLSCFVECCSPEDLQSRIKGRHWSIGTAFYIGALCLINQVEGGSEFMTYYGDQWIDSLSVNRMIEDDEFMAFLNNF